MKISPLAGGLEVWVGRRGADGGVEGGVLGGVLAQEAGGEGALVLVPPGIKDVIKQVVAPSVVIPSLFPLINPRLK